jgi:membrane-bound ClpP family serine protease
MKAWVPLALQALAFAVGFAEVMLPSFGLLSLLCAALFAWSWVLFIQHFGRGIWLTVGLADLVLIPVCIRLAFIYLGKSSISHRTDVGHGSGLESLDTELRRHVGASALADTPLRPTGRIRIGDETYEAQTAGDFVERGSTVKVISVAGSRFQVEKSNP